MPKKLKYKHAGHDHTRSQLWGKILILLAIFAVLLYFFGRLMRTGARDMSEIYSHPRLKPPAEKPRTVHFTPIPNELIITPTPRTRQRQEPQ